MNPTPTARSMTRSRRRVWSGLALTAGAVALAACAGSAPSTAPSPAAANTSGSTVGTAPATAGSAVLPITGNPIDNPATRELFAIDGVLVENNVDPVTGKAADDHLEIAVTNTSVGDLTGFEVYYTLSDPTTGDTESYYTRLPDTFTVAAGAHRTIHFDGTGATDHFPDNPYSLYHTSRNGLDVTVEVSALGAAPQIATVQKDPGGDEVAD